VIVRPGGVQIGNRFVPTGGAKSMLLNFSARLSDPTQAISAADVIAGTVPKRKIDGKIVLVGSIDSTLGDQVTAPVNKSTGIPGVLLHANAVNTMLTGTYLEPVSNTTTLLWVAGLTALIAIAVLLLPLWLSVIITILLGLGYVVLAFARFNSGQVMNFVYPSLAVIFGFVGALGLRYFGETRQRRRVTTLFSQYVPEAVAQRLVDEDRASTAVEGERLDMTVRSATSGLHRDVGEPRAGRRAHDAEPLLRPGDRRRPRHGRHPDEIRGDEVFAVWGAPLPSTDHPQRALECAIAIQDLTPSLNRELVEQGAPEVSFGIG